VQKRENSKPRYRIFATGNEAECKLTETALFCIKVTESAKDCQKPTTQNSAIVYLQQIFFALLFGRL